MILLAISTLISAALVIISRNIVYALAFLVTTFFLTAALLINMGLEFLGYVLIVVYVGAIAILFLFVVIFYTKHLSMTHFRIIKNILREVAE